MYMAGTSWGQVLNDFNHILQGCFIDPVGEIWVNVSHEFQWTHNMTTKKLYAYFIIVRSHTTCHGISYNLQLSWLFSSLFRMITMKKAELCIIDSFCGAPSYWQSTSDMESFSMSWCHMFLDILSVLPTICSFPSLISPASPLHVITKLIMTWEPSSPMSITNHFKWLGLCE